MPKKPTYGYKEYMETVVKHGAQDRSEKALLEKRQHPYQHTRKQAVSMAAEQMVSNNPTLHKVSLSPGPIFIVARLRATGRYYSQTVVKSQPYAGTILCIMICMEDGDRIEQVT